MKTDDDGETDNNFGVPAQEVKKMLFYEIEACHLQKHTAGPNKELQKRQYNKYANYSHNSQNKFAETSTVSSIYQLHGVRTGPANMKYDLRIP